MKHPSLWWSVQKHIQNLVKHPRLRFPQKWWMSFLFWLFLQKSPSQIFGKILSLPLKPVETCGKSSISDVWQDFEFIFVWIVFAKLLPICLLNLINIFHHISELCTVKSTWPHVQHICLITKIIIVFPNHVFL